jgi:hypothetical protein
MKALILVAGFVAALLISYGFALAGEPQAKWLWCEVGDLC